MAAMRLREVRGEARRIVAEGAIALEWAVAVGAVVATTNLAARLMNRRCAADLR